MFDSLEELARKLAATGYFIDPVMVQVVYLAAKLQKPLLLEGPAGSGKAQAALWEHEQDARDQFSSLHLFIHYWAQGKQENRRAWAQAMNAVVTGGTGSGAVLFQSFPQEVVDAFAEVTGGQRVRVRMPKTVNGYAWFDDERRAFLVERIANPQGPECEKRVFLFQYKGKRNLLFENTSAPIPLGHS